MIIKMIFSYDYQSYHVNSRSVDSALLLSVCLQRYVCVLSSYKATHSDDKWRDSRTEAGPSPTPPPDYSQRRVLQNGHVQGHR